MRFRYLGDKDDMTAFGYDFSGGLEPDVEDERAIAKLLGNSHFEAVEVSAPKNRGGRPRKNAEQP